MTVGWHLYQATGNPFDLALVGLVQLLPIAGLFIVTGWVLDNLAAVVGPVTTVVLGSAMAFAVTIGGYRMFSGLRALDRLTDVEGPERGRQD